MRNPRIEQGRHRQPKKDMFKYQVFLSFRGPDVRHHFLDILYADLLESGFDVFKDNMRDWCSEGKSKQTYLKQ
ncbi:hypothetical protein QQ045_032110 [Rhodiola kirilowii]